MISLAERVGFEPTIPLRGRRFSSLRARSLAQRTRTQTPICPASLAHRIACELRGIGRYCNSSATVLYRPPPSVRPPPRPPAVRYPLSRLIPSSDNCTCLLEHLRQLLAQLLGRTLTCDAVLVCPIVRVRAPRCEHLIVVTGDFGHRDRRCPAPSRTPDDPDVQPHPCPTDRRVNVALRAHPDAVATRR